MAENGNVFTFGKNVNSCLGKQTKNEINTDTDDFLVMKAEGISAGKYSTAVWSNSIKNLFFFFFKFKI